MGPVHRFSAHSLSRRGLVRAGAGLAASLLAASGVLVLAAGCAEKSAVQAENREIRLTRDLAGVWAPAYSPDGRWIAYVARPQGPNPRFEIDLVPPQGGEPRTIFSDSTDAAVLGWAADSQSLYFWEHGDLLVRRMGIDGTELAKSAPIKTYRFLAVAPDGQRILCSDFNGDNTDLSLARMDGRTPPQRLAETKQWEIGGCFGPGPGEVTAVVNPVYGATVTEFSVWSPDTREYQPLPLPRAFNGYPDWSADGRYLAYSSDQSGDMNVWVFDAVAGKSVQITGGPEQDVLPRWSPDGATLGFVRRNHTSHIFLGDPGDFSRRQITHGDALDSDPMLSNDGAWMVFMRDETGPGRATPNTILCTASTAANSEVRELDLGGVVFNNRGGACWSPDASELAFSADDGSGNVDIYRVAREGGAPTRVTVSPGVDVIPAWSPDGRTIAYTRPAGGETQVWTIPATGGIPKQITFQDGVNQTPSWAPDSRRLAFLTARMDGTRQISVVSAASPGKPALLYESHKLVIPFDWTHDGRQVLVMREGDKDFQIVALNADGSGETLLGEYYAKNSGRVGFFNFTAAGEKYRSYVYPGGKSAFADGEDTADLYALRVAELLHSNLRADGAGGTR